MSAMWGRRSRHPGSGSLRNWDLPSSTLSGRNGSYLMAAGRISEEARVGKTDNTVPRKLLRAGERRARGTEMVDWCLSWSAG